MPKLTAPLLSTEAHGTLADLLTYSKQKGRAIARRKSTPAQPRSLAQRASRSAMSGLAALWSNLTPAEAATWLNAAHRPLLPAYHTFMSYNVNRLKNLPGLRAGYETGDYLPSAAYPATLDTGRSTWTGDVLTGETNQATWKFNWTILNDGWTVLFHRLTAEHPWPVYQTIIGLYRITGLGWRAYLLPNLQPGPAKIGMLTSSRTGKGRNDTWWRETTIH